MTIPKQRQRAPRSDRDEGKRARAVELRASGKTLAAIGRELGVTHQRVSALLKDAGVPGTQRRGGRART